MSTTFVDEVFTDEWRDMVASQNIEYWECVKCGFRVSHAQYMNIIFEPTCRCGNGWRSFRSVSLGGAEND